MADSDRLTISEAATLLGVHPNTVRNRIKDGTYLAEKMITTGGPKYYIERDSLVNNFDKQRLPHGSQQVTNNAGEVAIQHLLTDIINLKKEDHEHEKHIEAAKIMVEASKTQIVASAGVLIAVAAITNQLDEPTHLETFYIAVSCILVAIGFSLSAMYQWGRILINVQSEGRIATVFQTITLNAGHVLLVVGLLLFIWFISANL
jgi:hypothetical protein